MDTQSDRKLDDEQKQQTKTHNWYDRPETVEPTSPDDSRRLSNTSDTESDGETTSDNENITKLLSKIKAFTSKLKKHPVGNEILSHEWEMFMDFYNLVDKNVTDEDLSILERGLKRFFRGEYSVSLYPVLSADPVYAKDIFYIYFSLINANGMKNYLKSVPMSDRLKLFYCNCIKRILQVMCEAGRGTVLALNDDERLTNHIELLSLMLNYVKKDLESSDVALDPTSSDSSITRTSILQFISFYSDKTILIPDLIEAGGIEIIVEGLSTINKAVDVHSNLKQQLIITTYNISRHDDGSKHLKALNAAEEIKLFQSNNDNTDLDNLCCMALPLLAAPDRIKYNRKRMNDVLDKLLQLVYGASVSLGYRDSDGFHMSEPLVVLAKLFNNVRSLTYTMEYSQVEVNTASNVEFFVNLLINYYSSVSDDDPLKEITCIALVNILWRVSFEDNYKEILKNADSSFQELIQKFAEKPDNIIVSNHYVPDFIEDIQKAAQELLANINTSSQPAPEQTNELPLQSTTTEETPYPESTPKEIVHLPTIAEETVYPERTAEETLYPEKPIEQWNKNDISQWFQDHGVRPEFQDMCRFEDGSELLNYAGIFLDTEKLQYQMYSDEFSKRSGITSGKNPLLLHEFTKFSTALRKLEKFNQRV